MVNLPQLFAGCVLGLIYGVIIAVSRSSKTPSWPFVLTAAVILAATSLVFRGTLVAYITTGLTSYLVMSKLTHWVIVKNSGRNH